MADSIIKYISLENLSLNNELLKNSLKAYTDQQGAKALKTVTISSDGKKLLFYTVSEPVGSTLPAFEIELPQANLDGVMMKVITAINGHIPVFENGAVKDSGTALSDIATKDYVDEAAAEAAAKANKLEKQIVTTIPTASEAKDNVIYLYKVDSAVGDDKYEEYMLIGGEVVMIGTTSTDLSGYLTEEQVNSKIADAKQAAIDAATDAAAADATSKANQALADAKSYTNSEIAKVSSAINANTTAIEGINETLNTYNTRISAVETKIDNIQTASEADIRALFT